MSLLAKLLALANRPGTVEEGQAARVALERRAEREGLRVIELTNGALLTAEPLDEERAEMMDALLEFADGRERSEIEGGGPDAEPE